MAGLEALRKAAAGARCYPSAPTRPRFSTCFGDGVANGDDWRRKGSDDEHVRPVRSTEADAARDLRWVGAGRRRSRLCSCAPGCSRATPAYTRGSPGARGPLARNRGPASRTTCFPLISRNLGALLPEPDRVDAQGRSTALRGSATSSSSRGRLPALQSLAGAGIPTLLLKGAALAVASYPDPGSRTMEDVDILVPLEDADRALDALIDGRLGHRLARPAPGASTRSL